MKLGPGGTGTVLYVGNPQSLDIIAGGEFQLPNQQIDLDSNPYGVPNFAISRG